MKLQVLIISRGRPRGTDRALCKAVGWNRLPRKDQSSRRNPFAALLWSLCLGLGCAWDTVLVRCTSCVHREGEPADVWCVRCQVYRSYN